MRMRYVKQLKVKMKKSLMKKQRGQKKNTERRKKLRLQKGKGRGRLKKNRIWNQMSRTEEATTRMKCCLKQKKKQGRKTKASDLKEKKSRNNASEDKDDTESESEKELKMTRKMKKDGAEEDTKPRKKVTYPTCNTRSSPKALFDAMSCLTNERKRCLKQIGFKRYINFPIVELPSTLAYHVIENFHTPHMEIRLQKGLVKATRQKMHDILGIPMRNTKLQDLEQRDANDPFIAEWEAQYSHLKKLTPPAIAFQISSTTEEDFMFKMNFITLFGSTIGTLDNGERVPKKLLKCIKEEDDIAEIDWKRIQMETRQKCLGSREHHRDFNLEEEQIGIDLYKGLDVYIEPLSDRIPVTREEYYEKIIQKFDKISEERSEMVRTLRDGVTKFENYQMMIEFCKQYKELFNDNELNVSESSIYGFRECDSDADDNNKKNDDERATMTDGNKKSRTKAKDDGDDNIKEKDGSEAKDEGYEVKDDVNNENDFENLSGNDTEDEVSMDIDILNEEMKQKEADKEKVSDKNGNESKKGETI
nr:hypothetical protein [Tanacetum cinerariifolium]